MKTKIKQQIVLKGILFIEAALIFLLFSFSFSFSIEGIFAEIGENATVDSGLNIDKSDPNIISIDIESGSIVLLPNSTKLVNCSVIIEDFDGDVDLSIVNATLFHSTSSPEAADDNNNHYTNDSCGINTSYGDQYQSLSNCLFSVEYYANPGFWNCTVYVEDISAYTDIDTNDTTVQDLLAVSTPPSIDYGIVNATYVSDEQLINVTNVGNIELNLSLSGYGYSVGDGFAMNCSLGNNISVNYEKYNLTQSIPGDLTLTQFEQNYTDLNNTPVVKDFDLGYRQNDTFQGIDDTNETYWRIYVPFGTAGTCSGNIVFGATEAGVS